MTLKELRKKYPTSHIIMLDQGNRGWMVFEDRRNAQLVYTILGFENLDQWSIDYYIAPPAFLKQNRD